MTRPLRDWPQCILPRESIVIAPQNTTDGRISRAGYETEVPTPGSRNQMRMSMYDGSADRGAIYAWLINNAKSVYFRVPVWKTPQLATSPEIDALEAQYRAGIPFSTGQTFSTGYGFRFVPTLDLVDDVLEGETSLKIETARYPNVLTYGKVFGLGRSVYHVDDIAYDGTVAQVECRTPFRRDYTAGELVSLRPSMICMPADISSFIGLFRRGGYFSPGPITLNEVIDERFL